MTLSLASRWGLSLLGAAAVSMAIAQFALSQQPSAAGSPDARPLPTPPGEVDPNQASNEAQQNFEVLEQGPVHEAFAEPLSIGVEQGLVIEQEPPQPIQELPPEYRPEGENVEWVPGYWMWLEDRSDFVWVSGLWRSVPPGRAWTPGHWATADGGYYWVSGFWTDVEVEQVEYLPYPPESLEQGPTVAAPSNDHFWIPGCWNWQNNNYAWRPGYWYPGQANWLWVPNRYVYTPRGAILAGGYWDYPVQRRGLLYAPVYWGGGYQYGSGFAYTPNRVINTGLLLSSLFINNDRGYYYYGRGYGGRNNFYPWYANNRYSYYNPLFGFYSWQYGRDSNRWRDRFDDDRRDYDRRDDRFQGRRGDRNQSRLIATVDDLQRSWDNDRGDRRGRDADGRRGGNQFRRLTDDERREAMERSRRMQEFRNARTEFESKGGDDYRARLSRSNDGDRGERRYARVEVPQDYKPATFNLRDAAGAEELRRQSRSRNERYQQQVMRENLDGQRRSANEQRRGDIDRNRDDANRQQQLEERRRDSAQRQQLEQRRQDATQRQQLEQRRQDPTQPQQLDQRRQDSTQRQQLEQRQLEQRRQDANRRLQAEQRQSLEQRQQRNRDEQGDRFQRLDQNRDGRNLQPSLQNPQRDPRRFAPQQRGGQAIDPRATRGGAYDAQLNRARTMEAQRGRAMEAQRGRAMEAQRNVNRSMQNPGNSGRRQGPAIQQQTSRGPAIQPQQSRGRSMETRGSSLGRQGPAVQSRGGRPPEARGNSGGGNRGGGQQGNSSRGNRGNRGKD